MDDLVVIGGGPAGTSAAITAARNGLRVLLLERGRFPRHKVCGEFVSAEALGLLSELLDSGLGVVSANAVRISRARCFIDDRLLDAQLDPAAASIARFDLDRALWDSAAASGVETKQQVVVKDVSGGEPFLVTTSAGQLEARAIVNASGRWSNLSAPVANGNGSPKWIGLKAHFAELAPAMSVDLYFFEGGYCGVQPVNQGPELLPSRINVCAMARADVARTLADVFQRNPALCQRAAQWQALMDPIRVAPLAFGKPQPVQNHMLMVGDAAGFVDPFIGDGISLALRSGALAAKCLLPFLRGTVSLEEATHGYADQYERQFARVFRSSSKLRQMLRLPRALRATILSLLANSAGATRYLVRKTR